MRRTAGLGAGRGSPSMVVLDPVSRHKVTAVSVADNATYSVAAVLGGEIRRDCNGNSRVDTLPSPQALLADFVGVTKGVTLSLCIVNNSDVGEFIVLQVPAGYTARNSENNIAISPLTTCTLQLYVTSVTAGEEAIDVTVTFGATPNDANPLVGTVSLKEADGGTTPALPALDGTLPVALLTTGYLSVDLPSAESDGGAPFGVPIADLAASIPDAVAGSTRVLTVRNETARNRRFRLNLAAGTEGVTPRLYHPTGMPVDDDHWEGHVPEGCVTKYAFRYTGQTSNVPRMDFIPLSAPPEPIRGFVPTITAGPHEEIQNGSFRSIATCNLRAFKVALQHPLTVNHGDTLAIENPLVLATTFIVFQYVVESGARTGYAVVNNHNVGTFAIQFNLPAAETGAISVFVLLI